MTSEIDSGVAAAAVAAAVTQATEPAAAYNASDKQKGASKTSRIPIKIVPL